MNCSDQGKPWTGTGKINRKQKDMSTWGSPINLDTDAHECGIFRNYAETMLAELPQWICGVM